MIAKKIGEDIAFNGNIYHVRETARWYSCEGCAFHRNGHPGSCLDYDKEAFNEAFGECSGMVRPDKKYVVFTKVRQQ